MSYQVVVKVGEEERQVGGLTFDQAMQVDSIVSAIGGECGHWSEADQMWAIEVSGAGWNTIECLVAEEN